MPVAKPSPAVKSAVKPAGLAARAARPAPVKTARAAAPFKAVSKAAAKPAVKTAAKPVTKAVAKPVAKPVAAKTPTRKSAAKPAPVKPASVATAETKPPKIKLVRDSFTIPRTEYEVLDALKARLVKLTRPAKKSEVLRAGIAVLATLNDTALCAALDAVPAIKTGRPKKAK